jgi:hypothetical protein
MAREDSHMILDSLKFPEDTECAASRPFPSPLTATPYSWKA